MTFSSPVSMHRRRIARTVAQQDAVRMQHQHLVSRSHRGDDRHPAAGRDQPPQDVTLDPEVQRDDVKKSLSLSSLV